MTDIATMNSLWKSIHSIALFYPDTPTDLDKKQYKAFFIDLQPVIPCYKCSLNYKRHLGELPIDPYLESKDTLFEWTVMFHNIVNKELGKRQVSLQEALAIHTGQNNSGTFTILIVLILLACIPVGFLGWLRLASMYRSRRAT
jgi:hypothetical protein